MSSLVTELQSEALKASVSVTDLLRKALVVATKLGVCEFEEWIHRELNGYGDDVKIPDYRRVSGSMRCVHPTRGFVPFRLDEEELSEKLSSFPLREPISVVERRARSSDRESYLEYPAGLERSLMGVMQPTPLQPVLLIAPDEFARIADAAKNIVLDWSLRLEKDGIRGQGMTFSEKERHLAARQSAVYVTNIYGAVDSQVQVGATDSTQSIRPEKIDTEEIQRLVGILRDTIKELSLKPDTERELAAEITTIESQSKSPKPKMIILSEAFRAIRSILESAAGSVVAAGILQQFPALLGR